MQPHFHLGATSAAITLLRRFDEAFHVANGSYSLLLLIIYRYVEFVQVKYPLLNEKV